MTSTTAGGAAAELDFKRADYTIRGLPADSWPYNASAPKPLDGKEIYDEEGVSVRVINGRRYNHPVLQAQFMLTRLSSYRHNHDPAYLTRVEAHAKRLATTAVHSRGALYLPYPFEWPLHGDQSNVMKPPWFSAMAQGQALSAFVRLYEVTGKQQYREIADGLFASFKNLKRPGVPWTVDVDDRGYLWFEEYAKEPGADRAFNGHVFATYGLYDYYRLTRDAQVERLMQGGLTAAAEYMWHIRQPGQASRYCLTHHHSYPQYHAVHVEQLAMMFAMTAAPEFDRARDAFTADFPRK
ncbi:D-glucuronyl C5-epimerase family protein [Saccharopolyspora mangrovi]|uniref:D-glucuronyl C5-epimerase family protein n=1 Tax=Saccharopolyspora mangrovi TaxID=3082379 RepID=A0ABU6AEF4_9PSEU|nr:D-glucuronyl C5-epimerase family protein [Saccharopolyspora sp. S2-29]MEB3369924.1 D-glucuronyl C5-epimerase family protein [Saccharopolyspora sp. S2-29]